MIKAPQNQLNQRPAETAPIPDAMAELSAALADQENLILQLAERLTPVRQDEPDPGAVGLGRDAAISIPRHPQMLQAIKDAISVVNENNNRLRYNLRTLQL